MGLAFQQCLQLLFVMIKFSLLRFPPHFSTIRYPDYVLKAFHLNKKIRGRLALSDLQKFIKENDQQIKKYATTTILQYFHEFPLRFIYNTQDSELTIYRYVLELSDLNIYEEQLKQGVLARYKAYANWQNYSFQQLIEDHQKHIQLKIETTPFDIVDAFNWIIIKHSIKCNKLFLYSISIICETTKDNQPLKYSKSLANILKRMEEIEWSNLRQCKKFFELVCYDYKLTIQTLKQICTIIQTLSEMRLHAVGYTQVPSFLDGAFEKVANNTEEIGPVTLLKILGSFMHLPIYYKPKIYKSLFCITISKYCRQFIYARQLPLLRMTEKQIQALVQLNFFKELSIKDCIYYMNMIDTHHLFRSESYSRKIQSIFFGVKERQIEISINNYQSIICAARTLEQHYSSNLQMIERVHAKLKELNKYFLSRLREEDLIGATSLQNKLTYVHFALQISLIRDKNEFQRAIKEDIRRFSNRKMYSIWKIKKHNTQFISTLAIFINTKHEKILNYLNQIVWKEIEFKEETNSSFMSEHIFFLQKSKNHAFFKKTIDYYFAKLENKQLLALVEIYVSKFDYKSAKGTIALILQIYEKSKEFVYIGKIIAGVPFINLTDHHFSINKQISSILNEISFSESTQTMSDFNLIEITNMVNLCLTFYEDLQNFTKTLFKYLAATLVGSYKDSSKYVGAEDQILLFKALEKVRRFMKKSSRSELFGELTAIEGLVLLHSEVTEMVEIEKMETMIYKSFNKQRQFDILLPKFQKIYVNNINNYTRIGRLIKLQLLYFIERSNCSSYAQFQTNLYNDIKKAYVSYELNLNDLRVILGETYYKIVEKRKTRKHSKIEVLIQFAFQLDVKQDRTTYMYFLRLGHLLQMKQVVKICMKELLSLNLEPFQFMETLRIAENMRMKLDNKIFEPLDNEEMFQLMYALTITNVNIKHYFYQKSNLKRGFIAYEQYLLKETQMLLKMPYNQQTLKRNLNKNLFKYYHFVIQNDAISTNTLQILKFSIFFYKQLSILLKDSIQKEHYYILLYLLQRYEKTPQKDQQEYKKNQAQKKPTFFRAKTQGQTIAALQVQQQLRLKTIISIRKEICQKLSLDNANSFFEGVLKSQGIKPKKESQDKKRYYESSYICNGNVLSNYIQDNGKRYGIIYYSHQNPKGTQILLQKILSELVGFPVMAVDPTKPQFKLPK